MRGSTVHGLIMDYCNLATTEGSLITFQCDPGFSTAAEMTAICSKQQSTDSLSTGQAVGITVVVTFIVTVLIGLAVGVGVTYLIMHDKTHKTVDVSTEAPCTTATITNTWSSLSGSGSPKTGKLN